MRRPEEAARPGVRRGARQRPHEVVGRDAGFRRPGVAAWTPRERLQAKEDRPGRGSLLAMIGRGVAKTAVEECRGRGGDGGSTVRGEGNAVGDHS